MTKEPHAFSCSDITVAVDDKMIVNGVDLVVNQGEIHAIMGPNGSGKSTLAAALMGHPGYAVEGEIFVGSTRADELEPDQRSQLGMFLGFQYPVAVPGVSVANFLRAAVAAHRKEKIAVREFRQKLQHEFEALNIPWGFASRYLNDGFSGGEKKRLEVLQMLILEPKIAILDEIDSGLDIDALKTVAAGINRAADRGTAVLLVTHYQRILGHVRPNAVHVFMDGRIVRSGGPEQALELEERGYEWLDVKRAATGGM